MSAAKLSLTVTMVIAFANQKPFDSRIGKAAHPVTLQFGALAIAHLKRDACKRENKNDEADERDCDRKQA